VRSEATLALVAEIDGFLVEHPRDLHVVVPPRR
jgi:hypothetical protein